LMQGKELFKEVRPKLVQGKELFKEIRPKRNLMRDWAASRKKAKATP